jgi:hypothetical protein
LEKGIKKATEAVQLNVQSSKNKVEDAKKVTSVVETAAAQTQKKTKDVIAQAKETEEVTEEYIEAAQEKIADIGQDIFNTMEETAQR